MASPALTTPDPAGSEEPGRPRRRLRVLQMIGYLSMTGGAERFAQALATELPPERFETWLCAPRGGEAAAVAALERSGVRFVDLGRRHKLDVHRLAGLAALLRRERFDVLHSHMFSSNLWASVIGRSCRVPVLIAHEHTWSYEGDWLRVQLDRRVIGRLTTRFVAVSRADATRMRSVEGIPAEKISVLPTAYVPSATRSSTDLRAELGLPSGALLVGTAAVMRPQKALGVLLEAHARLLERGLDVHLVLAGDGETRPELEALARSLRTTAKVHFLGRRTDVDAILRSLDVAALSSDFEGLPLLAFECMASDTPLVSTAVGGLPDLIEDGVSGVLVPRRDPAALARALGELLADPGRRTAMAAAARPRLADYRIEVVAERFATLYEELVTAAGARDQVTGRRAS